MKRSRSIVQGCVFLLAIAATLPAASISLDTVGTDPDLLTPFFTFTTDELGSYAETYRNVSNPPQDFLTLQITAIFSPEFYFGTDGPTPRGKGTSCDGGNAFARCSVTLDNANTTLIFDFFGIDAAHPGVPYLREFGIVASAFEPNQTIGASAVTIAAVPEPSAFGLAGAGLALLGFARRKQLLKFRVRS